MYGTELFLFLHKKDNELRITNILWKEHFVDKLAYKHQVSVEEVEQVLSRDPLIRRIAKGRYKGDIMFLLPTHR